MTKTLLIISIALLASCTVNMYDYSTHSGEVHHKPDTVYVEPGSPPEISTPPAVPPVIPPAVPDTLSSRRSLSGGGVVLTETCGGWTRHTLLGSSTETDGAFLEIRPVVIFTKTDDGEETSQFQLVFNCVLQSYLLDSGPGGSFSSGRETSAGSGSVLPVVTGTELISVVADRTTFPFLAEEAHSYKGDWQQDGTLSYNAVYFIPDWKMRAVCTADQLIAVSEDPEYRLLFGDNSRRLLQQFYDIFVLHGGEGPVLPVMERSAATGNR